MPSKFTPGLSKHKTRDVVFSLCVDDFGLIYKERRCRALIENPKEDWDPKFYLGVTLEFDYKKRTYKMSMSGYVKQALIKFHHAFNKTTNAPSPYKSPVYGQKIQMATIDTTNPMTTVQT